MKINVWPKTFINVIYLPLVLCLSLFEISIFNKEIFHSYIKLSKNFLETYLTNFSIVNNKKFIRNFILLQALLILARVDGKSPVEYFKNKHKDLARNLAKSLLESNSNNLKKFYQEWEKVVKT